MPDSVDWSAFDTLDETAPGLICAVASGDDFRFRSFGCESPGGRPLTPASCLYVASVAKQFTAACVGFAVLDGVINLDDRVRRWVPELPAGWDRVTVEHLVTHTAGLPESRPIDEQFGYDSDARFTTADRLALITTYEPQHEPGSVHQYSNHGYVLLAVIVERAAGQTLGAVARDRIFGPLALDGTHFLDVPGPPAVSGWADGTRRVDIAFTCVGDGGLTTCVQDLAKWTAWLPASPLASMMLDDRPILPDGRWAHDAWGISIRTHRGRRIESHGGNIDGYLATMARFPELRTSIIALANSDQWGTAGFGFLIRQFIDGLLGDALDPALPPLSETHGIPLVTPD